RKWNMDGSFNTSDADSSDLDLSKQSTPGPESSVSLNVNIDKNWGDIKGEDFIVRDLVNDIMNDDSDQNLQTSNTARSSGILSSVTSLFGSSVTDSDIDAALSTLKDRLIKKNVTSEVADALCESVKSSISGTSKKAFTRSDTIVTNAMEQSLKKVLTPSTSIDLLHDIKSKIKGGSTKTPYVLSIVGVNGVGKSTSLSKVAYWLLQNKMKILIAACDTFRSGAVEQLRVHVSSLKELCSRDPTHTGDIDIFEQGYGKDAAITARDAVSYGAKNGYDVVLIDTAGRRHNDQRLMSSLEKFANLAKPDKIIMVAEALVGTDAVQQAKNFNNAFGPSRNVDYFLISKCDTVGDMLGTMVNMTYTTQIPIIFVGTGQMYTDLRTLSVQWAVSKLLA
ncbi:hypothetical protein CANCADRAFT_17059, partial [Tortispora caseinolytica NRRL Y-17796]